MSAKPFSHAVVAHDIPAAGRHFRVEADEAERRTTAEALGIPEIARLTAEMEVRPVHGGAFSVRGEMAAEVVQIDVVTLEPVPQTVAEKIDLTLVPAEGLGPGKARRPALIDADEPESPDVFHNGRIDLGAIATEHLATGLDPYPRASGVEFPGHIEDDSAGDASPFAALVQLKREGE